MGISVLAAHAGIQLYILLVRVRTAGEARSGLHSAGAHLDYATITSATFARADLTETKLVGVSAAGASFEGATLLKADFSHAKLANVNFDGADLTGAKVVMSDLMGATFVNAKGLDTVDFTEARNHASG